MQHADVKFSNAKFWGFFNNVKGSLVWGFIIYIAADLSIFYSF